MTDDRRLVRGYPAQWQARYGDELVALVEDVSGGRAPSRRVRASLLVAGLKERLREQALIGRDCPRGDRVRAGSRVILIAWAALVVAGCGFAKSAEHWQASVPLRDQPLPGALYATIVVLAALGAAAVLAVAVTSLPCLRHALSAGLWPSVRRPVVRAARLSLLVVVATVALALSARHLTAQQRNGSSVVYVVAFAGWVVLIIASIGAWTAAALAVERRLDVTPGLQRAMQVGAGALATCTVAITGAMLAWWIAVARIAPGALSGQQLDATAPPWSWPFVASAAVAVAAAALAVLGAARLASAARSGSGPRLV